MKVFDLQCTHEHVFEGWFASEEDFLKQIQSREIQCPLCGDPTVSKKLSAPRLNLSGFREVGRPSIDMVEQVHPHKMSTALWLELARKVIANTTDVGDHFAEEARKIHYGEVAPRDIRGTASVEDVQSLSDEGVELIAFPIPEWLKTSLQ